MSDNLYTRQEQFKLNTDIVPVVIGCGGVGYYVAKMLAMVGVENIVLFDDDIIEEHNLSRLDLPLTTIGMNKTEAVKLLVKQMRPDCRIQGFGYKFNPDVLDTLSVDVTHIIDCTDKHAVQLDNQAFASNKKLKYCKVGYDFRHITIGNSIAEWDSGDSQDGYRVIPSYVVTATVVAALAVNKILTGSNEELSANLEDLYIGYK